MNGIDGAQCLVLAAFAFVTETRFLRYVVVPSHQSHWRRAHLVRLYQTLPGFWVSGFSYSNTGPIKHDPYSILYNYSYS